MDATDSVQANKRIVIGLCTQNRSQDLRSCLMSLAEIERPEDYQIECLIVENLSTSSISDVLASTALPFAVTHVIEPRLGVVHARNRLFTEAERLEADWLAMIDDDELAERDWLVAYVDAIQALPECHFFCGPYVYTQPHGLSRWRRPPWTENWLLGKFAEFAKTGNAVFHRDLFATNCHGHRFDPRFNQTGGEDYDLSLRIIESGEPLIFVPGARIVEPIRRERSGFRYGVHRAWRDRYVQQKFRHLRRSKAEAFAQDLADLWQKAKSIAEVCLRLVKSALRFDGCETRFLMWDLIFLGTQIVTILTYPISRDFVAYGVSEASSEPFEDAFPKRRSP